MKKKKTVDIYLLFFVYKAHLSFSFQKYIKPLHLLLQDMLQKQTALCAFCIISQREKKKAAVC